MWAQFKLGDYRLLSALGLRLLLLGIFLYTIWVTAWLSDDILISLRQVWNFNHGDGITYNWGQRVQAFTHPSWFFVLSAITLITQELFYTTLACNIICATLAIMLLFYYEALNSKNIKLVLLPCTIALLIFSKSFTDYLTSGLENSFSFLLAGIALIQAKKIQQLQHSPPQLLRNFFLVLALLVLTRFDHAVLFFPLLLWGLYKAASWPKRLKAVLPGGLLIASWLIFSIIYFGMPFPNTFYAKLGTLYPIAEIFHHGWNYFLVTWKMDPITLIIIALGIFCGILKKDVLNAVIALGICCYIVFIYRSGGDFMQGRFLSILVYMSAFTIMEMDKDFSPTAPITQPLSACLLGLFVIIGAFTQFPFLSGRDYVNFEWVEGIADERGFYYQSYGMRAPKQDFPAVKNAVKSAPLRTLVLCGGLGRRGLDSPDAFLIDSCALTDPFLSHLPAIHDKDWRIGHHERKIPTNYSLFLLGKTTGLADTDLNPLLFDIQLLTSGKLFTVERFKAIARVNIGQHYEYSREKYASPDIRMPETNEAETVAYDAVNHEPLANGIDWNKPGNTIFTQNILVKLDRHIQSVRLNISLDNNDSYELLVNDKPFELQALIPGEYIVSGLKNYFAEFPEPIPIEKIQINVLKGDGIYSIGHLNLNSAEISAAEDERP